MKTIGFIGTGNMGGALARAAAKNPDNRVLLANRHPEKAEKLAAEIGAGATDTATVLKEADYVFLGVKPNMLGDIAPQLKAAAGIRGGNLCLVSMLAGTAVSAIDEASGGTCPVIRIMPNTPVAVGEGMILYDCSDKVSSETENAFLEAMKFSGSFSKLAEKLIDAGSAVSGCGPAFVALFIEALADGGVACGLPRAKALEFAAKTVAGTARLMIENGEHPGVMKDAVCSPGGTTIQGVRTLEERAVRGAVMDAVIAAYEKTLKL